MHILRLILFTAATVMLGGPAHAASDVAESFEGGSIPSTWTADGQQWSVVDDPDQGKTKNRVLFVDALDDHVATLAISKKPLGDGTLTFRSRYETPYRSVASAEKNDGKHFPHWRMNLMPQVDGTGLVFTDNHVWNTLQLSDGDQPRDQQEGLRPQKRWIVWSLLLKKGTCTVQQDGHQVLKAAYSTTASSGLSFTAMHTRLWLDDIAFKP